MISVHIKVVFQRFLELLFTNIVISVFVDFLNLADIIKTDTELCVGLTTGFALFVYINVRLMRQCYFEIKNKFVYFFVNILAYLMFAGVSFGVYYYFPKEIFSFLFAIFKFMTYSRMASELLLSAIVGHIIGFLCIFLSPVGMKWVFARRFMED